MTAHDFFADLPSVQTDELNALKMKLHADSHPNKLDISAGVYRADTGKAYEFPSIKKAKDVLFEENPSHEYNLSVGIKEFNAIAEEISFGKTDDSIVTCQTLSGTGACSLGIKFLIKCCGITNFYVGVPTWPNYIPMAESLGGIVKKYNYYDDETRDVKFDEIVSTLEGASGKDSAFIFQAVAHNPTGMDLSEDQWKKITEIMKRKKLIAVIDSAYQGLLSGLIEKDRRAIEIFHESGLQFIVCQSFSKKMGIYGERVGAVHVVTYDQHKQVQDQLRSLIRKEYSSAPAYGARIATTVYTQFKDQWYEELLAISEDLKAKRQKLYDQLKENNVPGDFEHLLTSTGMFWWTGIKRETVSRLTDEHHVYLPKTGRVNIAGLNDKNIPYFVKALKESLEVC